MRSAEVVVTDLRIIEGRLRASSDRLSRELDFAEAKNLVIIQKWSYGMLRTLEVQDLASAGETCPVYDLMDDETVILALWQYLPSTIMKMKGLQKLCIWLEPSDPISWSNFNERAILSAIEPLTEDPRLDLCLEIPEHYHSGYDAGILPFKVERQRRMRYYSNGREPLTAACRCGAYRSPCIDRKEDYALKPWRVCDLRT
jgi:hypothetical protein